MFRPRVIYYVQSKLSGLPPDLPRHCPSLAVVRLSSLRLIYHVQTQSNLPCPARG